MKNNNIHDHLPKAEVRDLISKGFVDCINDEAQLMRRHDRYEGKPLDVQVKLAQQRYDEAKTKLELAKKRQALGIITEIMGWDEFDVSDETIGEYDKHLMSFIGTQEEYDQLIITIDDEKDSF